MHFPISRITSILGLAVCANTFQEGQHAAVEMPQQATRSLYQEPNLGLAFIPNLGQFPEGVEFQALKSGMRISVLKDGIAFERVSHRGAAKSGEESKIVLRFLGASSNATVQASEELLGRYNYYLGSNPENWREHVPSFSRIKIENLYDGLDLDFYESAGNLKYDVTVRPGADSAQFLAQMEGGNSDLSSEDGDFFTRAGELTIQQKRPLTFRKRAGGEREEIDSSYRCFGPGYFGFQLCEVDYENPIVIDPVILLYSTFVGGSGAELNNLGKPHGKIAVDSTGNAYIAGSTASGSASFPWTPDAYDSSLGGSLDAFVVKLNPTGSAVLYGTYIGGGGDDEALDIDVDSSGKIYITGYTKKTISSSTDFPAYPSGAFDTSHTGATTGDSDAFISIFNSNGTLSYSTFVGGGVEENDPGGSKGGPYGAIRVDGSGQVHITGSTLKYDFSQEEFPVMTGTKVLHDSYNGFSNSVLGFYFKLSPNGTGTSDRVYATFLGSAEGPTVRGSSTDGSTGGSAIDVDSAGKVYISGRTRSIYFPITTNSYPTATSKAGYKTSLGSSDGFDAFLLVLNPDPATNQTTCSPSPNNYPINDCGDLIYGTYLGGGGDDYGFGLRIGSSGTVYIAGQTKSSNFPTANAYDSSLTGTSEGFLLKLDIDDGGASGLKYGSYIGGSSDEAAHDVFLGADDDVHIVGFTNSSSGFPTTGQLYQGSHQGNFDAFVARFYTATSGTPSLKYSSFLGGSSDDQGRGIALKSGEPGAAFVVGIASSGFPTTGNAADITYGGSYDAFVTKIPTSVITVQSGTSIPNVATGTNSGEYLVDAGGLVIIVPGTYTEHTTLDKPATYISSGSGGNVTIN